MVEGDRSAEVLGDPREAFDEPGACRCRRLVGCGRRVWAEDRTLVASIAASCGADGCRRFPARIRRP